MSLPAGYTQRAAGAADLPSIERLLAECDAVEGEPGYGGLARQLRGVIQDEAPRRHGEALAIESERGDIVACAAFALPDYPRPIAFARLAGAVHPQHRRRGIGTSLLRWSEERAVELFDRCGETRPRSLRISFGGTRDDAERLYRRAGYAFHERILQLRRPLSAPVPAGPLTPGISTATWSTETGHLFYAAYNAVHTDEPEARTRTEAEWCADVQEDASLRPDLSLVALDGGRPCAFILSEVVSRAGRNTGWIWRLGVDPAYRRRGMATALLTHALGAFQREGLHEAGLWVDEVNDAARATYARLGFEQRSRLTTYARNLGPRE